MENWCESLEKESSYEGHAGRPGLRGGSSRHEKQKISDILQKENAILTRTNSDEKLKTFDVSFSTETPLELNKEVVGLEEVPDGKTTFYGTRFHYVKKWAVSSYDPAYANSNEYGYRYVYGEVKENKGSKKTGRVVERNEDTGNFYDIRITDINIFESKKEATDYLRSKYGKEEHDLILNNKE